VGGLDSLNLRASIDDRPARVRAVLASLLQRVGSIAILLQRWNWANAILRRAHALDPGSPEVLVSLSTVADHAGPPQTAFDPLLGLVTSQRGDLAAATRLVDRALQIRPDDAAIGLRRGAIAERSGDHDDAARRFEAATAVDPGNADAWYRLGRTFANRAADRGGFLAEDFERHRDAMEAALAVDPTHHHAAYHVVRMCLRGGDTAGAFRTLRLDAARHGSGTRVESLKRLFAVDVSDTEIAEAEGFVATWADGPDEIPPDFWFIVEWRFHQLGRYTAASNAKRILAQRHARSDGTIDDLGIGGYVATTQASISLQDFTRARRLCEPGRARARTPYERTTLDKLRADLDFVSLGVPPPRYHARSPEYVDLAGEERFTHLIEGRRVAVVGPSSPGADHGDEIDGFDTVIRTKQVDAPPPGNGWLGRRTDISYFANTSAQVFQRQIAEVLETGAVRLAVFRPSALCLHGAADGAGGRIRYATAESSAPFQASQFAIQRIIYDIARYEPTQVKLFNTDFFLGDLGYAHGYRAGEQVAYRNTLRTGLEGYGHDLRADFEFTKTMVRAGVIETTEEIRGLLALTPQQYLAALDRREKRRDGRPGGSD
jgi:tetratricopeptide (TPR) repeat protein